MLLQVESSGDDSDGNDPDIPATSVMSLAPSPQSSGPLNGMRVTFRVVDLSYMVSHRQSHVMQACSREDCKAGCGRCDAVFCSLT